MRGVFLWLILVFLNLGSLGARAIESGTQVSPQNRHLQAGDYIWQPKTSPTGPLVIVVDLSKQVLQVYRDGMRIGQSTISSGMKGYATPTGIFTILQKRVTHHSNVYHEASMPYTERLTWSGLAIHAGNLPGYPESHGCVHVPMEFARKLYDVTKKGATVLVTDDAASASPPAMPDLVFSRKGSPLPLSPPGVPDLSWKPEASPTGSLCIVFSSTDRLIYVYRGGVEIGRATVGSAQAGQPVGDRVYTALAQITPDGFHDWKLLGSVDASPAPNAEDLLKQLAIPPAFLADMKTIIAPGTTLVLTDQPVNKPRARNSGQDILDTASQ